MSPLEPRVDAHLHIWDLDRSPYRWLTPDLGPLHATITADRAAGELSGAGVTAAVLVQADDTDSDTELMLRAARAHGWVAGVVAWVPLEHTATATGRLEELASLPVVCGVRHLVHDDPRADFLDMPTVRASLRRVAAAGLALDVPDAWPRHLTQVAALATDLPELTVVLDHLGKPPADPDDLPTWRRDVAAVAARPNTVTKLSGLQHLPARSRRIAWDAALGEFGPGRILWGSDWPMTLGGPGYAGTVEATMPLLEELTADERAAVLGGTADRVYRLDPEETRC